MDSKDSMLRELSDKLLDLSLGELSEVAAFVERLRAERIAATTQVDDRAAALDARLAQAVAAGVLRAPEPNARRFTTIEAPPLQVSGRPASEVVLEDRR